MKVSIDAGGRKVELECPDQNITYRELADKALEVWTATVGVADAQGIGFGLADAGRAGIPSAPAGVHSRWLGEGAPTPVTA